VSDDAEARRRIRHQLDRTLFVEAGAGTGKTSALVGRIVELVATGTAPMHAIAAITFTEAAAGELRDRIRQSLEQLAASPDGRLDPPDDLDDPALTDAQRHARVELAQAALGELDAAAISTLHGFAQRILTEHPFEAGLPPTFEVYDQIRSRVAFDDRWGAFLDQLLDDTDARPSLQRALVSGVTLVQLREVALELNRNWDLVADHLVTTEPMAPVEVGAVVEALGQAARLALRCADPDDLLVRHVQSLAGWADRLDRAESDLARLQLLAQAPALAKRSGGRKDNWDGCIDEVRQQLLAAQAERDRALQRASRQALGELLVAIRQLTLAAAEQRRADGTLEFHDLLVQARHLVRTQPEVTAQLHATYTHLLIDEFQDTDPIQIELAVRIATDDPDPDRDWTELVVPDGRLFFVGDPKQAIYRFRRADIGLFLTVRDRQLEAPLSLTRNHRSVPGVLGWVNAVFAQLMADGEPGIQPAYEALAAHRHAHVGPEGSADPADSADSVAPVVLLGGPVSDADISHVRATEAGEIASTIARVRDEGWPVGPEQARARLADVCVLIPTRTSLPAIERALDERGLPYRVESSSLVYASAEVRDLLNVLRAVDDPTDEVAVAAALRSAWFGCGDDDLYEFHTAGGRWDHRQAAPESLGPDHPVVTGLAALADLHRSRWWHDASGLIEQVLVRRRAFELGLDERRPRDVWRRLHFVLDQARLFTDAYGADLRRYLAWAALQSADDARVVEAILPETDDDAVRIMTVHASKGLEFPVVALAGLNTEYRVRGIGVDVLWSDSGMEVKLVKGLDTAGYTAVAEREQLIDQHEQLRLLYVAATRARDHLIVSLHHKAQTTIRCQAAELDRLAAETTSLWRRLEPLERPDPAQAVDPSPLTAPPLAPSPVTPPEEADEAGLGARRAWMAQRASVLDRASRPATLSATRVARLARDRHDVDPVDGVDADETGPDEVVAETTPWRRGRAGTAIGRAVHGVLQRIDLATGADLGALAASQAGAEGVADRADEVEHLVTSALSSGIVQAAVSGGRYWREVYVGAPVAGRTLEGFVDLLIDGPDGLTVVDYKTDAVRDDSDLDAVGDAYRWQGAAYAVALEQALGRPVVACVFLFLRADQARARPVLDLDEAKSQVRMVLNGI
jgi:ATP-dependent helicase/nuclease subunit A